MKTNFLKRIQTFIFGEQPTKEIIETVDNFFGKLSYIKDPGGNNHWFGVLKFKPVEEIVEVRLYGKETMAFDKQRALFNSLESKYDQLNPIIERFINVSLLNKDIKDKKCSIDRDLEIDYISIYNPEGESFEIAFRLIDDFCWYKVYFENWKPIRLDISA